MNFWKFLDNNMPLFVIMFYFLVMLLMSLFGHF